MASIVAYIEVREGAITAPSLFAIGEARRIAHAVGATVYAFLPVGPISHVEIDGLVEQISAAGADRTLCSSNEALAGPPLDVTHGTVLAQLAEHLRPLLFLFPAGAVGAELGPPLAVRIGAAYVPAASVEIQLPERSHEPPSHRVLITRWRSAGDALRRIDVGDLERPVVAVLHAGVAMKDLGEPYAEVEMLPYPTGKQPQLKLLGADPDPQSPIESCSTMVCVPDGIEPADLDGLRAEMSSETSLQVETDCDLARAAPEVLFLLSSNQSPPPIRANAVQWVSGSLADLRTALRRLRTSGEESSG